MTFAVVALGSNIAPRRATLREAVRALAQLPSTRLIASSPFRETEAQDAPPGSGPFVNAACLLDTQLSPDALLDGLLAIERDNGRTRGVTNAPRTLDLDLILHGTSVVRSATLSLPHPRAHERLFVLEPAPVASPPLAQQVP